MSTHCFTSEKQPALPWLSKSGRPALMACMANTLGAFALLMGIVGLTATGCSDKKKGTLVIRWKVQSPVAGDPTPCATSGITHVHLQVTRDPLRPENEWPTYRFTCSQKEVRLDLAEGIYTIKVFKEDANGLTEMATFAGVEVLSNAVTDPYGVFPPGPVDAHDINLSWCGNGILESNNDEECDNGQENSDTLPDHCRTQCRLPACGDGIADSDEACDASDLKGATCEDLSLTGGMPSCGLLCELEPGTCLEPAGDLSLFWSLYTEDGTALTTCSGADVEFIRYSIRPRQSSQVLEQGFAPCADGTVTIEALPLDIYTIYLEGLSSSLQLNASGIYPSHNHNLLSGTSLDATLVSLPQ